MKTAVFVMFQNESPILGPFMDQLSSLFDYRILLDHESTDAGPKTIKDLKQQNTFLFHLKAAGYPQSEVATFFTKWVFQHTEADWLFFLDCDEFLPFKDRVEFETALSKDPDAVLYTMYWRNICPNDLSGGDIFKSGFSESVTLSPYPKRAVSRRLFIENQNLVIGQGYHAVFNREQEVSGPLLTDKGLLHLPIQSRLRFATKIRNAGERLIAEKSLLESGRGFHWVTLYRQLQRFGLDKFDFRSVALNYPDIVIDKTDFTECVFKFDYVKSSFKEAPDALFTQIISGGTQSAHEDGALTIYDEHGGLIFNIAGKSLLDEAAVDPALYAPVGMAQNLYAPLFSLPVKLPSTAWFGHIPFLFVLMKLVKPRSYVDLGVHYGASLIAAATASASYKIPAQIYGVDTWGGDEHAGFYEGEKIYQSLLQTTKQHFKNVTLIRSLFDEAAPTFLPSSIDILHIDGLHTYEAVKHDFEVWISKMAPHGVIMFHDTQVFDRGFGVYKFWRELQAKYTTMEFKHCFGLGVLFLDPNAPTVRPLVEIAKDPGKLDTYLVLAEGAGNSIHARMKTFENKHDGENSHMNEMQREIALLHAQLAALESEQEAYRLDREFVQSRSGFLNFK